MISLKRAMTTCRVAGQEAPECPGVPPMDELEVAARALCEAEGGNPDQLSYPGLPMMVASGRGFAPPAYDPRPMWQLYIMQASAVARALKAQTGSDGP